MFKSVMKNHLVAEIRETDPKSEARNGFTRDERPCLTQPVKPKANAILVHRMRQKWQNKEERDLDDIWHCLTA